MANIMKYKLLIIGIIIIVASAFLLAEANSRQAACQSIGGQIVQIFNAEKQQGCGNVKYLQFFAYLGIAAGVGLSIIGFVRRK